MKQIVFLIVFLFLISSCSKEHDDLAAPFDEEGELLADVFSSDGDYIGKGDQIPITSDLSRYLQKSGFNECTRCVNVKVNNKDIRSIVKYRWETKDKTQFTGVVRISQKESSEKTSYVFYLQLSSGEWLYYIVEESPNGDVFGSYSLLFNEVPDHNPEDIKYDVVMYEDSNGVVAAKVEVFLPQSGKTRVMTTQLF